MPVKKTKVKKLGNESLGLAETQRREAIIKESLDRTKNVSPNQLSADQINGGSPAQLAEQERIRKMDIEQKQALLNAPPPASSPLQNQGAGQVTSPPPAQNEPNKKFSGLLPNSRSSPLNNIDSSTATTIATNLPAIGAGAASGAALGATLGSVIPGVGTAIGGVIGGVIGGISAVAAKIAIDKHQTTKEAYKTFTVSSGTRYPQLLNLANSGIVPPDQIIQAYNENLANIRYSQQKLQNLTRTAVGKQLSGAQDELISVESWIQNEPFYRAQLIAALQNPNPSKLYSVTETPQNE